MGFSAHQCGRILQGVVVKLGANGAGKVDVESVAKIKNVNGNIGNLMLDGLSLGPGRLLRFVIRFPLKKLHQFGGFNGDGHAEIFGRVKLFPVPVLNKFFDIMAKLLNRNRFVTGQNFFFRAGSNLLLPYGFQRSLPLKHIRYLFVIDVIGLNSG